MSSDSKSGRKPRVKKKDIRVKLEGSKTTKAKGKVRNRVEGSWSSGGFVRFGTMKAKVGTGWKSGSFLAMRHSNQYHLTFRCHGASKVLPHFEQFFGAHDSESTHLGLVHYIRRFHPFGTNLAHSKSNSWSTSLDSTSPNWSHLGHHWPRSCQI